MTKYNIIAPDRNILLYYCRKHGIKPQEVRQVTSMEHLLGTDRLIVLSSDDRGMFDFSHELNRLIMYALNDFRGEVIFRGINTSPEGKR